jgi:hypothetical protein
MPSKWQQWMPFRIDAFKSSPAVQAMHPAARCGYLYLLSCARQTEDCTISADPFDLAEMSGLGDELWAIHGPRILRKFTALESGRLQNEILFEEWRVAKKVFDRRQDAANRTNKHRWSIGDRSVTDLTPNRSANTRTGTETVTTTEKKKTIARSVPPEELEEIQTLTKSASSTASSRRATRAEIETLYNLYPKHIGRKEAEKKIEIALRAKPYDELLLAVQNYRKLVERKGIDQQYIPNPATWFHQGRYEDEEIQPKPKAEWVFADTGEPVGRTI